MIKLYFLGGEDVRRRNAKNIDKKAFLEAGGAPIVLEFPWTADIEKTEYRKTMIDYFKDLGAKEVIFAELSDSVKNIAEKINRSNLIYFPGGEPKILVKRLRDKKIDSILKNYDGVIVGNSAGSLALCKKYAVIEGQDGRPKTTFENGLGFVDFAVSVEYRSPQKLLSGKSPARNLKNLSKEIGIKIYAIPETSAIVFNDKKIEFIGDIFLFHNGRKIKCK